MIALIIAISSAITVSIFGTRVLIRFLTRNEMGQFIRQDGPQTHLTKRGTPTMGGLIIIGATLIGYILAELWMTRRTGELPSLSALLVLGTMTLMGLIGFIDDYTKISKERSLGLTPIIKVVLQVAVGTIFALLITGFPNEEGVTPGSFMVSFTSDTSFGFEFLTSSTNIVLVILGFIIFILWINGIIAAWSNSVNLTDGLDGLATGISIFSFAPYVLILFWQTTHNCYVGASVDESFCYNVRDPWELAIVAGAITGACFGFLWWNANPAKIFMGDTGSLSLGGAFATISILSHTELLAVVLGGVFVIECVSDIIQVGYFKFSRKMGWKRRRIFKMAPLHHHFEMIGWKEGNVVIRFWMVSAAFAAIGLGIFYAVWLQGVMML